jgi:hypothetical protein
MIEMIAGKIFSRISIILKKRSGVKIQENSTGNKGVAPRKS